MDQLVHGIAADATIRVMAAITTETVREAVRRHRPSPTVAAALGRSLTGALLLGSSLKEFDRLTVKIECSGAVEGIVAEAVADGKVRGYVRNPDAENQSADGVGIDVPGVIGEGMMTVVRESGFDLGLHREPYVGSVKLVSGEIGRDIANYLLMSEQIPSAVLLGERLMKEDPFVECAGGVMVQLMPGADENLAVMIEDTIVHSPKLTDVIREGATPLDLMQMVMGVVGFEVLEEKAVEFRCNCSRERAHRLISSLGATEIKSMLEEDKGAKMTCGFCNEEYVLTEADLAAMLA
jgi:molecular chaperone Hsp33